LGRVWSVEEERREGRRERGELDVSFLCLLWDGSFEDAFFELRSSFSINEAS